MRRALALVLLAGCALPRRPTYDDACRPSDPYYVDLASDPVDLDTVEGLPDDPAEALDALLEQAHDLGIEIRRKAPGHTHWSDRTTALPGRILLEEDWEDRDDALKAATIGHELRHHRQMGRLGFRKFGAFYVVPEGRWGLETAGYAQTFIILDHLHIAGLSRQIEDAAHHMRDAYELGAMPECTVDTTIAIWREAVGLEPEP